MNGSDSLTVEQQLVLQLAKIERQIADLETERAALQRLITKVRHQNVQTRDVLRKDSFDRLVVERRIIEYLGAAQRPQRTSDLYLAAKAIRYSLKATTFRSHLNRLKARGLLTNPRHGFWALTPAVTLADRGGSG